ncbi:MAG: competence protein ComEC family protein, partial [Acidobacteriota bacterium]|nr:competence protein ComEC family protein [Acidobacteriota bacterium]
MLKDPLVAPLLALTVGILLSRWTSFGFIETAAALALLGGLSIAATWISRRLALTCCLTALVFGGVLVDLLHRPGLPPSIDASSQETVILSGCVVDPPIFYEGRDQFTVELAPRVGVRAGLTLREGETPPDLRYGQRVEFEARVRQIRNFHNPGAFDFAEYSARRQIYWTASIRAGSPVQVIPGRCGSRFFAAIFALRTAALDRIEGLYHNDAYATGMMEAILLGESTKLEKIWTGDFRRTGTFHALVISGLHVTVLAGTLLFLLRICFVPQIPALAATAVAAWVYALVSGWSAPVVRAAGGFTLYLVGRYFYRRGRVMNLLAAVAIAYLLCDPGQMFESSFQLSFLSVAAIG